MFSVSLLTAVTKDIPVNLFLTVHLEFLHVFMVLEDIQGSLLLGVPRKGLFGEENTEKQELCVKPSYWPNSPILATLLTPVQGEQAPSIFRAVHLDMVVAVPNASLFRFPVIQWPGGCSQTHVLGCSGGCRGPCAGLNRS